MPYRYRPPMYNRRYSNNSSLAAQDIKETANSTNKKETADNEITNSVEIPLPNEVETDTESIAKTPSHSEQAPAKMRGLSLFDTLRNRIHIDDIILIGLLFLILDERLDDDFLILIVLYIFLF